MDTGSDDTSPPEDGEAETPEDESQGPPTGGVRIIGAQEAAEAVARGEVGRRPEAPADDGRPVLRFPRPIDSQDPSSFGAVPVVRAEDEPEEPTDSHLI